MGEWQEPNGRYRYIYNDALGKRKIIYSWRLTEADPVPEHKHKDVPLREKEKQVQSLFMQGISGSDLTVIELVERYISLKTGVKQSTLANYKTVVNTLNKTEFAFRHVDQVKLSDAKMFLISLQRNGLEYSSIHNIRGVIRPAFQMAVDDDMIRKNPFKFKVADILPDDAAKRTALTKSQQETYLKFIRENGQDNYYDDIVILLGTGLRVSELYGLTKKDIDFKKRHIFIEHQLCRTAEKPYFVTSPKTSSGVRCIPMSDMVYMALKRVVANRPTPTVEFLVDGYSGFLFLDKDGKPKVAMHLQNYMRGMQKKIARIYGRSFPRVTPHVLRHTFCTDMQRAGIDVKSLQYLMGHSNVSVTLDIYTHVNFDAVEEAFGRAVSNL